MSRSVTPARALWDVRVVGPALMVVFGLVLLATPSASVGITGSVGNAGVLLKDHGEDTIPPPVDDTTPPPVENPPPPSDPAPPVPSTEPDGDPEVEPAPEAGPAPAPEPEQTADPSDVLGTGEQAPAVDSEVLPRTGAGDTNALATMGGAMLLLGGAALLVAGRRSASSR